MAMKRCKPEEVMSLLRQAEVLSDHGRVAIVVRDAGLWLRRQTGRVPTYELDQLVS